MVNSTSSSDHDSSEQNQAAESGHASASKETTGTKATKKAPAKKTATKKSVAKNTVTKKSVAKKAAAKKSTTKKTSAKKSPAKKTATKKSVAKKAAAKTPTQDSAVDKAPSGQGAAFFDLDGTLISGSANIPLAMAAFKKGFVSKRELAKDLKNGFSFVMNGATDERSAEVRDRILQAVKGRKKTELIALGDEFIDKLKSQVQPEMSDILNKYGKESIPRVVISASPTEIVGRLANELGLEYGIGTTADTTDGVYNGKLTGPFCYKEGKAEVIRTMAKEKGWDLANSFAYSDSISDMPMLRTVGHPVAVNPEGELREVALAEGWPIVETKNWRSLKKREVPKAAFQALRDRFPS